MILSEYIPLIEAVIFNLIAKFLGSCYFCFKKNFHFSTICLIWFIINFTISSISCIFVQFDLVVVQIILIFSFIGFVFSAVNILLTFFYKFFKKKLSSIKITFLFYVLVVIINIGIIILIKKASIVEYWIGGKFLTCYNYGLVFLVLFLLIWHFIEVKK